MTDRLSLDFLTALDLSAADFVRLAGDLGLTLVSLLLRPLPGFPDFALDRPGPERRETLRALQECGVRLDMAEPFYLHEETGLEDLLPGFDDAAFFGARCVNLLARTADPMRLAEQMAHAAEAAAERGMAVVTEISKRGSLTTLPQTVDFIRRHDLPVTVELDSLHFWRAAPEGPDLAQLGPYGGYVGRIQICDVRPDVTPDQEWYEAVKDRALPGEGIADLAGFLHPLPPEAVIGIEIPQNRPGPEAARLAFAATSRLLDSLDANA